MCAQHLGGPASVGQRQDDDAGNTKKMSSEHTVLVSESGLVTVTGGKWTTYRAMAEDVLQHCMDAELSCAPGWRRRVHLPVVGAAHPQPMREGMNDPQGMHSSGGEAHL